MRKHGHQSERITLPLRTENFFRACWLFGTLEACFRAGRQMSYDDFERMEVIELDLGGISERRRIKMVGGRPVENSSPNTSRTHKLAYLIGR